MIELLLKLAELQARLEGATACNIFLLHKLGGAMTIQRKDLEAVLKDFPHLAFSAKDEEVYVKIASCTNKEAA
jgi:hypothetical protein